MWIKGRDKKYYEATGQILDVAGEHDDLDVVLVKTGNTKNHVLASRITRVEANDIMQRFEESVVNLAPLFEV